MPAQTRRDYSEDVTRDGWVARRLNPSDCVKGG
jgi:hypothetical protein